VADWCLGDSGNWFLTFGDADIILPESIRGSPRLFFRSRRLMIVAKASSFSRGNKRDLILILVIFCVAATLRLMFVFTSPPPPVVWMDHWQTDETTYFDAARVLLDVTRGEAGLSDAVDHLVRRGPIYPLFVAVIYGASGGNHLMVEVAQALTDALSCVLVYLLGKQVLNWRVGLLSAGIAVLYAPFILSAGRLLKETLASFLLLLVVLFLTRAVITWSARMFALGGVSLSLTILCNAAAQYLPPLLVITIVGLLWRRAPRRKLVEGVLVLAVGLVAPVALWFIITSAIIHTPVISAAPTMFHKTGGFMNNLDTDGWHTDYYQRGLLSLRVARDLLPDDDFTQEELRQIMEPLNFRLRVTAKIIRRYPLPFLTVPLKNFHRLWRFPHNQFRDSFIFSYRQQIMFHQMLIYLAVIGIPLSLIVAWRKSTVLVIVLTYFSLVYAFSHAEPRYNTPLMPFAIVMAAGTLEFLCASAKRTGGTVYESRLLLASVVSLFLGLLSVALTLPLLLLVLGKGAVIVAYSLTLLLDSLFLVSLGPLLYFISRVSLDRRKAVIVSVVPVLVLLVGLIINAFGSKTWHEWRTRLSDPAQRVRQTIVFPDGFEPGSFTESALMIDMNGGRTKSYDLIVEVNGQQIQRYQDGLHVEPEKFDSFRRIYNQLMKVQNREPGDLRQWFEIPFELPLLTGRDTIAVELYLARDVHGAGNYVDVYGDYVVLEERVFEGPRFPLSPLDTSVWKYIYDDDFRLESRTRLESRESSSAFYDSLSWSHTDLSPDMGVQSGEFRIRLKLVREDGTVVIL
jgi:4-amino-4-deoxy-L-arabinose transferase-like glycosyltransferase